ncbi:MAG: formimidoylglutamase [Promethearchaeota archaeon]
MEVNKLQADKNDPRFLDLIKKWRGKPEPGYGLLGVPFDAAIQGRKGARKGPQAIRDNFRFYSVYDWDKDFELKTTVFDFGDMELDTDSIEAAHEKIALQVGKIRAADLTPVILGGDHSITYASVKGIKRDSKRLGVINFDAHLDLRESIGIITSGTPFRRLIDDEIILPDDLLEVGIQNFKNARYYRRFAEERGITVVPLRRIRDKGIEEALKDPLEKMAKRVDEIFISIDMDVIDQNFSPGVSAATSYGMSPWELVEAIRQLSPHPKMIGMDVLETSPQFDRQNQTANLAAYLVIEFISGHQYGRTKR